MFETGASPTHGRAEFPDESIRSSTEARTLPEPAKCSDSEDLVVFCTCRTFVLSTLMRIPARKPIVLGYQTTDCWAYFGGDISAFFFYAEAPRSTRVSTAFPMMRGFRVQLGNEMLASGFSLRMNRAELPSRPASHLR